MAIKAYHLEIMRFIKQAQVTLIVTARLVGRLLLGVLATYAGIVTISLFSAYAFNSNGTDISYYVGGAFWKLFTIPFGLLDHYWGIPLVVAQFLLLFLFLLRNPLQLKWLLALSVLMICIGYNFTYWHEPKSIADFVCSLVVVCGLYWIAWWVTKKYKSKDVAKTSVPPNTNTSKAILLMTLLLTGLGYLYSEYFYPYFHVSDPEVLANPARARKLAQKVISHNFGDHHDAFLTLGGVGTEESVPYLINALQWEEYTPAGKGSMICTKGHCLGALRSLTNQNPGINYPEWSQWWESNKTKTRRQWVLDGFSKSGLPVNDPPDDAFVSALVAEAGLRRHNILTIVWLLKSVPQDQFLAAITKTYRSPSPSERKGAISCLWHLQFPDAVAMIPPPSGRSQ